MRPMLKSIALLAASVMLNIAANAQYHDKQHHDGVNQRGDQAMGFSHARTTHHFRLTPDGGLIEVTANNAADAASRDQIRTHLQHIAKKFSRGDFAAPIFIHAQTPPGVPAMKRLKARILYQFETIERGGQVRISSKNDEAVRAIHEFLRFQIKDHQTSDSTDTEKSTDNS